VLGAIAGAAAVVLCDQAAASLVQSGWLAGTSVLENTSATPFGLPHVVSLLLWGALWGGVLERRARHWPDSLVHWIRSAAFGALWLSLAQWFFVEPLLDVPVAAALNPPDLSAALLLNGIWGVGAAVLLKLLRPQP